MSARERVKPQGGRGSDECKIEECPAWELNPPRLRFKQIATPAASQGHAVRMVGFEPTISSSQGWRGPRLSNILNKDCTSRMSCFNPLRWAKRGL